MDNMHFRTQFNANKTNITNNNTKTPYDNYKDVYNGYVKQMENSDFANSLTRYQMELQLLTNMKKLAVQEARQEELKFIEQKFETLKSKLGEFGIIPKDI
ncbi:hypothetical protein IJ182_09005 [bacterium]|nr:hypothetical protein [bacterium]